MSSGSSTDPDREGRYFLPADYRPNELNVTIDEVSGEEYWNAERIASSARFQRAAYEMASTLARTSGAKVVVDVGCGVATKLTECFDPGQFDLVGIDQAAAVAACERLGRPGRYYADDLEAPSAMVRAEVGPADMVISSDVIEHLLDPDALLDYIFELVSPTGSVVLTTPERTSLRGPDSRRPDNEAHIREWSKTEFVRYVQSRGFVVEQSKLVNPFSFAPDRQTLSWLVRQTAKRRSIRTCHTIVARRRD